VRGRRCSSVIDKLRITGLDEWPSEAGVELTNQLRDATPEGVTTVSPPDGWTPITLELPETWPTLRRESLRNDVQKTLSKAEHDHGLEATLESIEETDAEERDATFS